MTNLEFMKLFVEADEHKREIHKQGISFLFIATGKKGGYIDTGIGTDGEIKGMIVRCIIEKFKREMTPENIEMYADSLKLALMDAYWADKEQEEWEEWDED